MGRISLRQVLAESPLARVVPPGTWREDDFGAFSAQPDLTKAEEAETVEPGGFAVYPVRGGTSSELTHFLDGAERKWRVGYYGMNPILLAHTSAALVQRVDRKIESPAPGRYFGADLVAFAPEPCAHLVQMAGVKVRVVKIEEGDTPAIVEQRCREWIQREREGHEIALAVGFQNNGWLLVDGGIGRVLESNRGLKNIVGIVKTHTRQYFSKPESIEAVLGMKAGERTSLFKRKKDSKQGAEVLSCYLKLRDSDRFGPLFGLVRLEIPDTEESKIRIDQIAGWVMHERTPLSMPDPRYDRLIYPIRLVEEHLKSRQPSDAAIAGVIG